MKNTIYIVLSCWLLSTSAFAQNKYQQEFIAEINTLTTQIEAYPNKELYVKRSQAIFMLNSVSQGQTWVPFTLEDAINDINNAIAIASGDALLYSLRAEYKRDIHGDYMGALNDMDMAIALDPDNPQWYLQRANYRNFTFGCKDYRQCATMGDKRCQKIVHETCGGAAAPVL